MVVVVTGGAGDGGDVTFQIHLTDTPEIWPQDISTGWHTTIEAAAFNKEKTWFLSPGGATLCYTVDKKEVNDCAEGQTTPTLPQFFDPNA